VLVLRSQPVPASTWKERFSRLDYLGVLLLLSWVIVLLLPLSWGGSKYSWNSPIIIALFCVFGVLLALFIFIQWKVSKEPLIPSSVFTVHRNPSLVFLANIFLGMSMMGVIYYVPTLYQQGMGDSATTAGVKFIPFMIATVLSAIVSGILISVTLKYRPFACLGASLAAVGTGLITTWTISSNTGLQVGSLILAGFGSGAFLLSALFSAQAPTRKEDLPVTTSLVSFCRSLGGVIGVAIYGAIFNNTLPKQVAQYLPNIDAATMTAIVEGDQTVIGSFSEATQTILHKISITTLQPVFYAATAFYCVAALLMFATAHVPLTKEELKNLSKEAKE
jgi:hypothetical protein